MKLLKKIEDQADGCSKEILKKRFAVRGVFIDENKKIPLLHVAKQGYYKLPGGGIESGEDRIAALYREVKEETGSEIKVSGEIGKIIEFRSKWNLEQVSYCYFGEITKKGEPFFTKEELEDGFKLFWLSLEEALLKIKENKTKDYHGTFVTKRDFIFLKEAGKII
jgi:8-oxo-dGTP diphosphatase